MAHAKNRVISGDYVGCDIQEKRNYSTRRDEAFLRTKVKFIEDEGIYLNKSTVASYEVVSSGTAKSGTSAVLRGAVGAAVLGPVGLLAGLSAKTNEIISVVVVLKSGKKSLIEINGKIYQLLVGAML